MVNKHKWKSAIESSLFYFLCMFFIAFMYLYSMLKNVLTQLALIEWLLLPSMLLLIVGLILL